MPTSVQDRPVRIVEPASRRGLVPWRELFEYRDLLYFLVRRDVRARYKQTVLGISWAVIRPLVSAGVFTVIFGRVAGVPSDDAPYALFAFAALVPWNYFSGALTGATSSLVRSRDLLTDVYFPRLLLPVNSVVTRLVDFSIAFVALCLVLPFTRAAPGWTMLTIPLLILLAGTTALGLGLWLSALAVQYRDVIHGSRYVVQMLMYLAPVVWPVSLLTERFGTEIRYAYGLYPLAGVVEGFRSALLGTRPVPWDLIAMGTVTAVVLLVSGLWFFRSREDLFADVV